MSGATVVLRDDQRAAAAGTAAKLDDRPAGRADQDRITALAEFDLDAFGCGSDR
jgi:hypothetical protein